MAAPQPIPGAKALVPAVKLAVCKTGTKDMAISPTVPIASESERTELLGSLTTQQQQRTSARVIKKLKLEPPADKKSGKRPDGTDDLTECDTPNKIDDKDPLKFPTVKQRMPKALWSTDEKSLFFEALNEYGKDFDSITAYICAKMKKKGMPDVNLKTKTQVSHFYYRTWHKLSKHVHFDENVKKVAQELYALINYGELRKKLASVSEKTCARLGEMVRGGSMVVRARGRNLRVRTPACRALRKLNQITERACGSRVCGRAGVSLRARDVAAWARVQAAAHNPRALLSLPLRTTLRALLRALAARWRSHTYFKQESLENSMDVKPCDDVRDPEDPIQDTNVRLCEDKEEEKEDLEDHLNLETDRIIINELRQPKKLALHVGPRPSAQIHLPVLSPSEQLSSQKICFSSYLERMCSQRPEKDGGPKIRTPKRQRKDSTTDKDKEVEPKKLKDDCENKHMMHIDETAIDGIELMASYKSILDDEEKPSTEDEKEIKAEETADEDVDRYMTEDKEKDVLERDKELLEGDKEVVDRDKDILEKEKDMSEKEKDSFSEVEDDEKYNKSDTDNESDQGKNEKGKQTKFKNLKVKFRLRPKKRGGSIYTLVIEKEQEEAKSEEPKTEEEPKPDIDVDLAMKQIRRGWSEQDAGDLTIGDLYLMFGSRSKLELDYWWAEPTPPLPQAPQPAQKVKPDLSDKDKHIEKKEKQEKIPDKTTDSCVEDGERARESDTDIFSPKNAFNQDSNDGLSGDERKGEQLASPEHKSSSSGALKLVSKLVNRPLPPHSTLDTGYSQLSDRLKRLLAMAGNPHITSGAGRCPCGHVCPPRRPPAPPAPTPTLTPTTQPQQPCIDIQKPPASGVEAAPAVFRHPTPIAPRPNNELQKTFSLEGVPRWRRGRPRIADRRVVVQRLLPLLPKLPPPNNLIPVKIVPNSPPAPPRILPKPPPTSTSDVAAMEKCGRAGSALTDISDLSGPSSRAYPYTGPYSVIRSTNTSINNLSFFYVLSESNGQFYFHDGDRRIPINPLPGNGAASEPAADDDPNDEEMIELKPKLESQCDVTDPLKETIKIQPEHANGSDQKPDVQDIGNFLPSESMSLSPSRLLRETEGWFEGSVQDFSLSSFLGHLEGRPQPDLAVDSHLQSLMAESSVDYVAKFADLAAEVTDEGNQLNEELN